MKVDNIEDHDQEIIWIEVKKNRNDKIFIGTYYGKQEKEDRGTIEREYSQIQTQINKLEKEGPIILTGDFNAKLEINRPEATQKQSNNGKHLQDLIDRKNLHTPTLEANRGIWTRENRTNPEEKSIIDYILTSQTLKEKVQETIVDEQGTHRIKGRKESDHNIILITITTKTEEKKQIIKRWKLDNEEGWKKYNEEIQKQTSTNPPENYQELKNTITRIMRETVGETKITTNKNKKKENEEVKRLREEKKEAKKAFQYSCKNNTNNKIETKTRYIESQKALRDAIERANNEETKKKMEELAQEGGTNSTRFWKMKQTMEKKKDREPYDTITEDGRKLQDPTEAMNHIADYYEDLYQAREGTPQYENWTQHIRTTIKEIERNMETLEPIEKITTKELNKAINKLKKKKSTGPDNIPNETFINADKRTREIYRKAMNKISEEESIPEEWQEGEIIRLYKGKGIKGKCSNERGITLSSNFGKLYERIINERANKRINITEAQAGGRKGSSTVDHLLILRELENIANKKKKKVYMAFLDVTKAYDKAWSDAIMYVMHKEGIKDKHWNIIKKLNENLTAKIATKYGETRKINIKDSIRQGGVLSVLEYGILMDEIAKEIDKKGIGIEIDDEGTRIACLLWVDDVVLITTSREELQEMLNTTNDTTKKYHIEFGKPKSNIMKRSRKNTGEPAKLGEMELEVTNEYKYLGLQHNNKNNLESHIKTIRRRTEAAYQKILSTAGSATFNNIEMKYIWKTLMTNIIPIITYSGEVWKPSKQEEKQINRIYENIIKRILQTPQSTPRESIFIETGLIETTTLIKKNRLMMHNRLKNGTNETMKKIINRDEEGSWANENYKIMEQLNIPPDTINKKKGTAKRIIQGKILDDYKERIDKEAAQKSKVQYNLQGRNYRWKPGKIPEYMQELTRNQVSTIFKARTRMTDIKANYKKKYPNQICRACNTEEETQEHVFEKCTNLHPEEQTKVRKEEIFEEDPSKLKNLVRKINQIMEKLKT